MTCHIPSPLVRFWRWLRSLFRPKARPVDGSGRLATVIGIDEGEPGTTTIFVSPFLGDDDFYRSMRDEPAANGLMVPYPELPQFGYLFPVGGIAGCIIGSAAGAAGGIRQQLYIHNYQQVFTPLMARFLLMLNRLFGKTSNTRFETTIGVIEL